MTASSSKIKGSRVEREVAAMMGGRRMILSGGSSVGGGDLHFPTNDIMADWLWEIKARRVVPELVRKALAQADVALRAEGSRKRPAAIIKADNYPPTVHFLLEDFVTWARAISELGQGAEARSVIRQMRTQLDQLERMTR